MGPGGSSGDHSEAISEAILDPILDHIQETSLNTVILLHLAVGRAKAWNMTKSGSWDWYGVGTGIAPSGPPQTAPPRVHPSPTRYTQHVNAGYVTAKERVVGLKSVAQLTLGALFSDLRGITEVYNLSIAGDR